MRKRISIIAATLLLMAAVSTAAYASGLVAFSASGSLEQTVPGALGEGADPTGTFPAFVIGTTNLGQTFEGEFRRTDWRPMRRADVTVTQNSFIAAPLSSLPPFDGFTIVLGSNIGAGEVPAIAWGTFEVTDDDDSLTGAYEAAIEGTLTVDFSCPAPYVSIDITDVGGWGVLAAEGEFQKVLPAGSLFATASGCIGEETAFLKIEGALSGDDDRGRGNDDSGDDEDNPGRPDRDDDEGRWNRGHGNDDDGDDDENPGRGQGRWNG